MESPPPDSPSPRLPYRLLRDGWWLETLAAPPARPCAVVIPFPARRARKPAPSNLLPFPDKRKKP